MADIDQLSAEQHKIAKKVVTSDAIEDVKHYGAVCVAEVDKVIYAGAVVCRAEDFSVVDSFSVQQKEPESYKSSFMFYHSGPAALEALQNLKEKPDVLFVNAHGIIHPRRVGMASHMGVVTDIPTIGVAKSISIGDVQDNTVYVDKEARGYAVVTKKHAKPLYVSPGHKISVQKAADMVKQTIVYPHKLPEPLHLAQKVMKKQYKK